MNTWTAQTGTSGGSKRVILRTTAHRVIQPSGDIRVDRSTCHAGPIGVNHTHQAGAPSRSARRTNTTARSTKRAGNVFRFPSPRRCIPSRFCCQNKKNWPTDRWKGLLLILTWNRPGMMSSSWCSYYRLIPDPDKSVTIEVGPEKGSEVSADAITVQECC